MLKCDKCGEAAPLGSSACVRCGSPLIELVDTSSKAGEPVRIMRSDQPRAARPWVRYWARIFDIYLFSILVGFVLGVFLPEVVARISDFLLGMVIVFMWVFVESLLLCTFQTTPGKWLLQTKLTLTSGSPIPFSTAMERSFALWWRGIGIGFPIAALITCGLAYNRLTSRGKASWDEELGFEVSHGTIGALRIAVALLFFAAFAFFVFLGSSS